jgi:hypothetical protein
MQELLNPTRIIYFQYWLVLEVESTFPCHMGIIQVHFGCWKALQRSIRLLGPLLDLILLDKQSSFPKLTLQNNYPIAMFPSHNYNLITWLWERFTSSRIMSHWFLKWLASNGIVNHQLLKWFKLVKLYMVMIFGSMKDKKTFSNLFFMHNNFKITLLFTLILLWECMFKAFIPSKYLFHFTQ